MKTHRVCTSLATVCSLLIVTGWNVAGTEIPAILFSYADRYSFFNAHEPDGVAVPGVTFAEVPVGAILTNQYSHLGLRFLDGDDTTAMVDTEDGDDYILTGNNSFTLQFTPPIRSLGLDFAGGVQATLFLGTAPLGVSEFFQSGFGGVIREDGPFDRILLSNPSGEELKIYNLYFYPTPQLTIRKLTASEFQIGWSTNAARYALQYKDKLESSWRAVTNTPTVSGNQVTVTLEATAPKTFFRLLGH